MLRRQLADYPGVVVLATDRPDEVLDAEQGWREWGLQD
jgi:hypothetical protein